MSDARPICAVCGDAMYRDLDGTPVAHGHDARARLFARVMDDPPSPDRLFTCACCGDEVHARDVTLDEHAQATCRDCTGRTP